LKLLRSVHAVLFAPILFFSTPTMSVTPRVEVDLPVEGERRVLQVAAGADCETGADGGNLKNPSLTLNRQISLSPRRAAHRRGREEEDWGKHDAADGPEKFQMLDQVLNARTWYSGRTSNKTIWTDRRSFKC
jgi:hypothetical protein